MPGAVGVSEEVVALLGAAAVARVSEPTGFRCMRCGIDGGVVRGDGASVVVMQFRDGARVVRLAHSGCAPSQIVEVAEDAPTPPSIEQDIKSLTLGVPSATGTRPVLLIQPDTGLGVVTPPGDIVDPWLAALFAVGWQMPQTVGRRPSRVTGCVLEVDPVRGDGRLVTEDSVVLDRLPPTAPEWFRLALENEAVEVFAGAVGLLDAVEPLSITSVMQALTRGVKSGGVAAAVVPVTITTIGANPGRDLADALEQALHGHVPGDGGALDTAPLVVPLPTVPVIHPVLARDLPLLVIDLNDPDATRAAHTLDALQDQGFPDFDPRRVPWPAMPPEWGALVWPTQVLIMAPRGSDGRPRKAVFGQLTNPGTWYEDCVQAKAMGLGLLWTNLIGRSVPPNILTRSGRKLAAAVACLGSV